MTASNYFPTNDLLWHRLQNEERAPDWRWQRAVILEEQQADLSLFEDKIVNRIRGYLRAIEKETPPDKLCQDFPVLYDVARIYNTASNSRWLLEALIMGNVPVATIVERFGWTERYGAQLVEEYEATKFDVRSRLKFDGYIQSNLLNLNPNIVAPSEERIWKLLAYLGNKNNIGTKLLDYYISIDSMPDEVKKWYDNLIASQLTKKTLRAIIRNDPMQSPLINELFNTYYSAKKMALDEKIAGVGGVDSATTKVHETLIKSLTMTTAAVKQVVSSNIEPRALLPVDISIENKLKEQVEAALVKKVNETQQQLPPVEN